MANTEQDPGFGYEAKIWKKNDPLAEADINHMELGIENAHGTLNKYILGRSTKQHFNINAAQVGYQLYKDGTLDQKTTGNYITSDLIRIYSDYDYKLGYIQNGVWTAAADDFEHGIYFGYVFFDKEQNVIPEPGTPTRIRSFSNTNPGGVILLASSTETGIKDPTTGAKYIRFCVWAPNSDFPSGVPDQLVFSSRNQNITEFEPYYTIKGDYFATTAMHNSLAYDLSQVITKEDSPNLLNVDEGVLTEGALEQSGTTIKNANSYRTTEFIPVEPNAVYACKRFTNRWSNSSTIAQYYALYSESGNMNSILTNGRQQVTSGQDTITIGNYTAPVYIRFSFKTSFLGSNIAFAKNTAFENDGALSSYRPYGAKYVFTKDLATTAQLLSNDIPDNATFVTTEAELRSALNDGVTPLVLTNNITLTPDPNDNSITRPLIITKNVDIYGKYHEIDCNSQGTSAIPSIQISDCVVRMCDLTVRNGAAFVIKVGSAATTSPATNATGGLLIANNCHFWRGQQVIGLAGYGTGIFIDCDMHTTAGTGMNTTASYDVINVHDYSKVYVQRCKIHEGYDEGISTHDNTYAEIYNSEVYNCGYAISYNNTYKATAYKGAASSYGGIHIGGTGMGIVKGNYSHDNATYGIGIYTLAVSTNHQGASQCIGNTVKHNGYVDIDPRTGGVTDPTPDTRTYQVGVNSGGIIISGAKNCEIRSNLILDNAGYGIRVGVDNTGSHYEGDRSSAGIISDNKMFGNLVYIDTNNTISGNVVQIDAGYDDGIYENKNIFDILKTKADTNGYYPELTAGYLTMGDEYLDETVYAARATLSGEQNYKKMREEALVGGTIYWHQMVKNGNFANGREYWSCNVAADDKGVIDNEYNFTTDSTHKMPWLDTSAIQIISSHKYLAMAGVRTDKDLVRVALATTNNTNYHRNYNYPSVGTTAQKTYCHVFEANANTTVNVRIATTTESDISTTIAVRNVMMFDLTSLFGPTIATYLYNQDTQDPNFVYDWFRSIFPNYYYNNTESGRILTVNCARRMNTGFNIFNSADVTLGKIVRATGNEEDNPTAAVSGYIPIFPGINYYHNWTTVSGAAKVIYFNGQKTPISHTAASSAVAPPQACYARINLLQSELNSACYKVYSTANNTKYKPYEQSIIYDVPTVSLFGIPYLDNGQLQYYGDEYYPNGLVTRNVRYIDFSNITNWSHNENQWSLLIEDMKPNSLYFSNRTPSISNKTITLNSTTTPTGIFIYQLENPEYERYEGYEKNQVVNVNGMEGYLNADFLNATSDVNIPIGHRSYYQYDTRGGISNLLSTARKISGRTVEIYCETDLRYQCDVVDSITIHQPAVGITDIIFTTNSTTTILNVDTGVIWPGVTAGQTPTLEPNTIYELNIMDGKYGVMTSWPALQN